MEYHQWLETSSTLCEVAGREKGEMHMLMVDTRYPQSSCPTHIQTQQVSEFHTESKQNQLAHQRQSFLGKILPQYRKTPELNLH